MPSTKLWFYGDDSYAFNSLWRACYLLHDYTRKCARVIIAREDACASGERLLTIIEDLRKGAYHPTPEPPSEEWRVTPEQAALVHDDLLPGIIEDTLRKLPEDLRQYRKGKSRWWTRARDFKCIEFPPSTIHFENEMLFHIASGGRARIFNRGQAAQIRSLRDYGRVETYEITRERTYEGFYTFTLHAYASPHPAGEKGDNRNPRRYNHTPPNRPPIRLKLPLKDMLNYVRHHPDNPDALLETAQLLNSAEGERTKSLPITLLALMLRKRTYGRKKLKPLIRSILSEEIEHTAPPPLPSYPSYPF